MENNKEIEQYFAGLLSIVNIDECYLEIGNGPHYCKKGPIIAMPNAGQDDDYKHYMKHEIGHLFLDTYWGDTICEERFYELFGSKDKLYYDPYIYSFICDHLLSEDYDSDDIDHNVEFLNAYAETHPVEDFCECFVEAISSVKSGINYTYGNRFLNRKITFIKKIIREVAI